jgi:iron complex outermembrane receptor protein
MNKREGGSSGRDRKNSLAIGTGLVLAGLVAAPTGAWAQAAEDAVSDSGLEEIVVTASRRSEALSRAPLAVSAVTQEGLDRAGVTDVARLSTVVPSLQIGTAGQSTVLSVRGISTGNVTELGNAPVAFYVDGIYFPRPTALSRVLYDVERVEVLRGPQGTLFGRNATAGAVNVITARPRDTFEAGADVAFGNYGSAAARGFINVPVTDRFFLRGSFTQERNDGYQDTTPSVPQNYYRTDVLGLRLSSLWELTDALSWQGSVNYVHDEGAQPLWAPIAPSDGYGNWERPAQRPGINDKDVIDFRSRLDLRLSDDWTLAYLAGYSQEDSFNQYSFGSLPNAFRYWLDYTSYSHEVTASYESDRLKGVLGLYIFREDPNGILAATSAVSDTHYVFPETSQESQAAFGQLTYSVTDDLRLTGGLRYSEDRADLITEPLYSCPVFAAPGSPACTFVTDIGGTSGDWSSTDWKIVADYDLTENTLIYASVGTGYKAGGLAAVGAPIFGPEYVTNYELGLKGRVLNGRLSFAATAFFMDYTDQQVSVVRPINGTDQLVTINAAASSISGLEFEASWLATSRDRFDLYVALLDAEYDDFTGAIDPFVSTTQQLDLTGNRLPRSPEISARFSYAHTFDLEDGASLTPQISVYAQSESYLREFNRPEDRQEAYAKIDGTLRYESDSNNWFAEAFVYNAGDVEIRNFERITAGTLLGTYAPPRTYGMRLGVRY